MSRFDNPRQPPPRPQFVPRTIINQSKIDPTIIAKLFLICQEGNLTNIKDYILSNGLSVNDLVNVDGQSILHVILLNDNITPLEKLEIFKFLASRNMLKFSYDSQQKTPLHIAAQKQLTEIVKILLAASHDVNALDATKRTPIYYAISGQDVDCPKKSVKLIETKKTLKISSQDELAVEIVKYMNTNKEIKNLLLHIYNTTKNLDSIFYDDINSMLTEDNKKIADIITSEKDEEKRNRLIFDKIFETRNSIIANITKKKLVGLLKPISMANVDANTWGPDTNPKNKFLKDVEPSQLLESIKLDYDKEKKSVLKKLEDDFTQVVNNFKELRDGCVKGIEDAISDLNYYAICYEIINSTPNVLTGGTKISNKIKSNENKIKLYGGANPQDVVRLITHIRSQIPNFNYEQQILNILPEIIAKYIDEKNLTPIQINAVLAGPIGPLPLGILLSKIIKQIPTLVDNKNFISAFNTYQIVEYYIRNTDDNFNNVAVSLFNIFKSNNLLTIAPLNPNGINTNIYQAFINRPEILIYLTEYFFTKTSLLLNVFNNINANSKLLDEVVIEHLRTNQYIIENVNYINALVECPHVINILTNPPDEISIAIRAILGANHQFIFNNNLIKSYQKNNILLNKLIHKINEEILRVGNRLAIDPRLINIFKDNIKLFNNFLLLYSSYMRTRMTTFMRTRMTTLTPQQLNTLSNIFIQLYLYYDNNDTIKSNYTLIPEPLKTSINRIIQNPTIIATLKSTFTPDPLIQQIINAQPPPPPAPRNFNPDRELQQHMTIILNDNIPLTGNLAIRFPAVPPGTFNTLNGILVGNLTDVDLLAQLFIEVITKYNHITLNDSLGNFLAIKQDILLKIIEILEANPTNIFNIITLLSTVFKIQTFRPNAQLTQTLINKFRYVIELSDVTFNLNPTILQQFYTPLLLNEDFIKQLIQSKKLENNITLSAFLAKSTTTTPNLLVPITQVLATISNINQNQQLIKELSKNLNLALQLSDQQIRKDIEEFAIQDTSTTPASIISMAPVDVIAKLIIEAINVPRSILYDNSRLATQISLNIDLALELIDVRISISMLTNFVQTMIQKYPTLTNSQQVNLKTKLELIPSLIDALIQIIRDDSTIKIFNTLFIEILNSTPMYNLSRTQTVEAYKSNPKQLLALITNSTTTANITTNTKIAELIKAIIEYDSDAYIKDKKFIKELTDNIKVLEQVLFQLRTTTMTLNMLTGFINNLIITKPDIINENDFVTGLAVQNYFGVIKLLAEAVKESDLNLYAKLLLAIDGINNQLLAENPNLTDFVKNIIDKKPFVLVYLADKDNTITPRSYIFVATVLREVFNINPDIKPYPQIASKINANPELSATFSKLPPSVPAVTPVAPPVTLTTGHKTLQDFERLCEYRGDVNFISRELTVNNQYDLINDKIKLDDNTIVPINPLEILSNPINPIDINKHESYKNALSAFQTEYKAILTYNQAKFIRFNNGKNYSRKLKIILNIVFSKLDAIKDLINQISSNVIKSINDINLSELLSKIIKINFDILEIVNFIPLLNDELTKFKQTTDEIKLVLENEIKLMKNEAKSIYIPSSNTSGKNKSNSILYSTFYEDVEKSFHDWDKILDNIDVMSDYYKNIAKLQDGINNIINFINLVNSYKFIINFNNSFGKFDDLLNNDTNIENIFDRKIQSFKKIFQTLNELLEIQTNDNIRNKINLIEKCCPQLDQYNYFSYYSINNPTRIIAKVTSYFSPTIDKLPQIGFLVPSNSINKKKLGGQLPKLLYGTEGIAGKVLNANVTNLEAKIGEKIKIKVDKYLAPINSISPVLDKHLTIIRNFIVRSMIASLYNLLINKLKGTIIPNDQNLQDLLLKIYLDIKKTLSIEDGNYYLFLTFITTLVDKILRDNIQNFIVNGITRFGFRENRNQELRLIMDELAKFEDEKKTDDNKIQLIHTGVEKLLNEEDLIALIKLKPDAYRFTYNESVFKESKSKPIRTKKPINVFDTNTTKCYSIDDSLIKLLLTARSSVSIRDNTGLTLIDIAIEMNDPVIVKLLVDQSTVASNISRNTYGVRPIDLALKQVKYYATLIGSDFIDNLIKDTHDIVYKKTQVSDMMRYHELFYKLFNILFNHLLFDFVYSLKLDEQKQLKSIFKFSKLPFPLMRFITYRYLAKERPTLITDNQNMQSQLVKQTDQNKSQDEMKYKDIEQRIKELNEELVDKQTPPIRKEIIKQELTRLQSDILGLSRISAIREELGETNEVVIEKSKDIIQKINFKGLSKDKNFIKMYTSLDVNIFAGDIKSVNNFWLTIFNENNGTIAEMDMIFLINEYFRKTSDLNLPNLEVIIKYLNLICNFNKDLNELDQKLYEGNYALDRIYEIIFYIMRHTISVNLLNIIQQLLRNELTKVTPQNTLTIDKYSEFIDEKIKSTLKTSQDTNTNLEEYISKQLLQKIFITTFNLETDKVDIKVHFDFIIKLLQLNGIIPLTNDSDIIKTLNDKIIPYFALYTEINMKKIKTISDGIFNILENFSNSLQIFVMVQQKAQKETN